MDEAVEPGTGVLHPKWPLVGRAGETERVSRIFAAGGRAVVLAGPPGVGKTRLAAECAAARATEGFRVLRVAAMQRGVGLPFGAYASFVPELAPGADRLEVLRQVAGAIARRGEGKPVVVLVDDAHLLDDASAALTHLLTTTDDVRVLATLRSGEPAPEPIVALWKDGVAERIDLLPLSASDIDELLALALGGPVDGAALHLLHNRTQGNVLFLREIVLAALHAGNLRREEGIWRLSGSLPESSRLVEIIESRLVQLDDDIRHSLVALAFGEPLEVDLLQALHPTVDLEALERHGLLHVDRDVRRLSARLHHPLYGEFLRGRLPVLSARAIARALVEAVKAQGARRRGDVLRLATWALEAGVSVEPETLLEAAAAARVRCDFPLAERLARAAVDAGAGFEASLLLAQTCWLQARADEAERILANLVPAATTDAQRATLASVRIDVLDFGLKRADLALRVAEEAAANITDPSCRDQITADRARILGRSGNYGAAVALAEPLLSRASGRAFVTACFAAATSMANTGQTAAAIEATERGLAAHLALTGPPLPFGPHFHLMIRAAALTLAGRLAEARALAEREYVTAIECGSVEAQPWFSWIVAWVALNEGSLRSAVRLSGESAGVFRHLGWRLFVRCALMVRAHALALQGDAHGAEAVLDELDSLGVPAAEFCGPEVLRARAWTAVAAADIPAARSYLEDAATMARSGGAWALESAALHDIARLGGAGDVAARLEELAVVVEGHFAPGRAVHAAALSRQDAARLEDASASFEDLGALVLAAEASADAAVAWLRRGEVRRATAAERRAGTLAARCEGIRTPSLAAIAPTRSSLTPRELEIARLAAAGLRDKEIAERLYLSPRTVQNKLHAAYEKLGVPGRAALKDALGTN